MTSPEITATDKRELVKRRLEELGTVAVAYSGGIDSALVLALAKKYLGEKAIAITAISASLAERDLAESKTVAKDLGAEHIIVRSSETDDPRYQENTSQRCYFCKTNVYDTLIAYALKHDIEWIVDGTNADDIGDHRPGLRAAREHGVRSPLQECGVTKDEIRQWARELGMSIWNKPANACLSSRIPYGSKVTVKKLSQVERAENELKDLGFTGFRVRHHDSIARLEIPADQLERAIELRQEIDQAIRPIGFLYVALDLAGFRSGSMNAALKKPAE